MAFLPLDVDDPSGASSDDRFLSELVAGVILIKLRMSQPDFLKISDRRRFGGPGTQEAWSTDTIPGATAACKQQAFAKHLGMDHTS
jgi:hypothetical protein